MSSNQYRYCIYCGADCTLGLHAPPADWKPEHADDCPSLTNVYPATAETLQPSGMRCGSCGELFALGDVYSLRPYDRMDDGTPICGVLCIGCSALDAPWDIGGKRDQ